MGFTAAGGLFSLLYMLAFVLYPMMMLNYFGKAQWFAGFAEILFAVVGTPVRIAVSGILADMVGAQICFATFGTLLLVVAVSYISIGKSRN